MHEPYLDCGGSSSRGTGDGSLVDGSVGEEPLTEAGGAAGGTAGRGIRMIDLAELQGLVEDADKAGLQVRGGYSPVMYKRPTLPLQISRGCW